MLRIGHLTITRQRSAHISDLSTTHGIGLAGQRKWSAPRPAYFPRRQMQIDDPEILRDATGALVRAHRPETQRFRRAAEPKRRPMNFHLLDPAHLCGARGRPRFGSIANRLPTRSVIPNEPFVDPMLRDQ